MASRGGRVLARHASDFPSIKRFPVTITAKDWDDAYSKFFADGKIFDKIYKPR